jgi:hypothetical protein
MKRRLPDGLPLVSWITLGAASLLFAGGLWSALHIAPLPEGTEATGSARLALDDLAPAARPGHPAPIALASDPFSPDRTLPDDAESDAAPSAADAPSAPGGELRLLGTVVRGNSPFALCQLPSDVPRIVHVGEQVGELTLISLDQGRAIFRARNGKQVELSLAKSGT